ncbi:MAG TPA: Ig-like domain-containing protein, partial [Candidatus Acidoferrum sp.]|nr:Ig-like domain-containing protein [Candidatus Acidoferrum sp.]
RRHLAILFTVSVLILGGFAAPSYGQGSCQLGQAVLIAVNSARTGSDVAIGSGNVVVNSALSGPTLGPGFSLYIDRRSAIHDSIKADRIRIFNQTVVSGSATFNQLTNDGLISGGQFSPLTLPVFPVLPPFQEANFGGTPANVSVASGTTRVLTPGEYGDITVATAGKITFTGGVYHIKSIDATGNSVILSFNAASEVRIQNKFRTRSSSVIGPAAGSGLSAANIVFYVGGINGTDGQLDSTPEASRVGGSNTVTANFYVPHGTARFESDSATTGAIIARDVQIDSRSTLSRNSAFLNGSPKANAQDVVTNGSEPLVITLTALDPEGGDMTFALQGGLQFPSRGSLGTLIQAPPPFPGNPPGCNPANTPGCIPPDPPRSSASITYTPSTGANEENSFTFSATDACGNTGMATVHINPIGDITNPPVATVVDATNVTVETATNTPRDVTLVAGAPPGATLTFSVQSLPAHGSLKDGSGAPIGSVPYTLPSRKVTYTPASAFTGSDTFQFKATGSVGGSDTASVIVSVVTQAELAQNQSVSTNVNTPLEISLKGNAGGSGAADAPMTPVVTQTDVLTGSSIAGNVSDADNDGLGDAKDNLPGPAPVLVAAGVDVNLGGQPSGTVSDPDSDATPSPNGDPDPDLVSATVTRDATNLIMQVRFKPGTFDPAATRAQFLLDTDRNPATGQQGSDSLCVNDNGIIGAEFTVNMGADLNTTAEVLQYQGTCNSFAPAGSGTTTFVTDGMDASVPLSVLGGTNGQVNFKVVTSELLAPNSFTGVLDYMPDVGLPAGQAVTGIQGKARVQIEWDISALPTAAEGIESATVTLSTVRGTVDSIDTFFYAGTAEQDGLLAVSDYQAPASQISGVVMPVPVGSSPGDEGTFVFNVTGLVKAARTAGRNFFSVQGRVNEALAGGGFKRGLQIRSTATSNLTAGKEPKLEVVTTPSGQNLTFKITSLPVSGTLRFGGSPVVINQTFAFPPTLLYTPNLGFTGNDSFNFLVTQGALSDSGLISILVNSAPNNCEINGRPVGCSPN